MSRVRKHKSSAPPPPESNAQGNRGRFLGVDFDKFVQENRSILIPRMNDRLRNLGLIDLTVLPEDVTHALLDWVLKVNRRRIESGQDVLVTYDIIKQCPIWQVVEMPYRSMSALGVRPPKLKTQMEQQAGKPASRVSPIKPKPTIKPRKPL